MKIAIVGADSLWWDKEKELIAKKIIRKLLCSHDDILVSGACPGGGIDIWAEEIADKLGMKKEIFATEFDSWKYYKERNIQIAKTCDILFDIEPAGRTHSGGIWTLNYAKKIGKQVVKIEVF